CLFSSFFILIINYIIIAIIILMIIVFGYNFQISQISNIEFYFLINLILFSFIIYDFFGNIILGLKLFRKAGIIRLFYSIVFKFLIILFYIFGVLNLYNAILILFFSQLAGIILGLYFFLKSKLLGGYKRELLNIAENYPMIKKIFNFSFPLLFSSISYYINFKLAVIILSYTSSDYSLFYEISTGIILMIIIFIVDPVNKTLIPYLSKLHNENNLEQIKKLFELVLGLISLLLIPILIFFYDFSSIFINIVYTKYSQEVFINYFKVIAFGGIFYAINQFLAMLLFTKGKNIIILVGQVIGAFINIIFVIIGFVYSNIFYSGIGFIFSLIIMDLIWMLFYVKYSNISIYDFKFFKIALCSLISIVIFEIIMIFFGNIYISLSFSLILYFSLSFILGIINRNLLYSTVKFIINLIRRKG
ncbi:MAG: oligosaccharide flippase family protein, partial [Promethearchaeota archaeon]